MKCASKLCALFAVVVTATLPLTTSAQIRTFAGYNASSLGHVDDEPSAGPVGLGFTANFYGGSFSQVWVNNNGNVTFDGDFTTYIPAPLGSLGRVIIAPFFADVDTSAADSGVVTYGTGMVGGRSAFAANYLSVGAYSELPIYNTFQVVLIDRADTGAGNFDVEFNYGSINWESGQATGGNEFGLGGFAARVGLSGGTAATTIELPGSGVNGALLDNNPFTGLIYSNPGVDFAIRAGVAFVPVPEPSTYGAVAAGLLLIGVALRKRCVRR
jgi:hypothetical protein